MGCLTHLIRVQRLPHEHGRQGGEQMWGARAGGGPGPATPHAPPGGAAHLIRAALGPAASWHRYKPHRVCVPAPRPILSPPKLFPRHVEGRGLQPEATGCPRKVTDEELPGPFLPLPSGTHLSATSRSLISGFHRRQKLGQKPTWGRLGSTNPGSRSEGRRERGQGGPGHGHAGCLRETT